MPQDRTSILNRLFVVFGLVLLLPTALAFQLFRIQFWEGSALRKLWSEQAIDYISIPAQRGNIYDDNGTLLVTNSVGYTIAVDPGVHGMTASRLDSVCTIMGQTTRRRAAYYRRIIRNAPKGSRYVVLGRDFDTGVADALSALKYRGVILQEKYKRRYNFDELAAQTIGYVNHKMDGMIGLESFYNDQLKGKDGLQQVRRDRKGRIHSYIGAPRKQPEQGYSLFTTLDAHIQAILEEELADGVKRNKANHGTAIVLDPRTGAVKAMANYPTFNPNYPARSEDENRRNYAISDMIEPGSTFKLVTAVAALEQGKVHFGEKIHTPDSGRELIHGQWMRDHDPLGTLTFEKVIQESSNIATSKIAMRLKPRVFYQYARNMGFGTPTNIDLPNEESGVLHKPYDWSQVTLPWMSIGYEVQTTALQVAQAYAAFANNGIMMRPYLVDKIVDSEGHTIQQHEPMEVRRIAEPETIHKLLPVFQGVVSDSGTAEWAKVKGLPIAGKTGTAQKYMDGRYRFAYRASFVGFFPVRNPRYLCLVILDEPKTSIYGGYTAGPIFRQVATRIAGLDNEIEKTIQERRSNDSVWAYMPLLKGLSKKEATSLLDNQHLDYTEKGDGTWVINQAPQAGAALKPESPVRLTLAERPAKVDTMKVADGYGRVPDLIGQNMRKASFMLAEEGLEIKMIGSGTIFAQYPKAGAIMKQGRDVTVRGRGQSLETLTASNTTTH